MASLEARKQSQVWPLAVPQVQRGDLLPRLKVGARRQPRHQRRGFRLRRAGGVFMNFVNPRPDTSAGGFRLRRPLDGCHRIPARRGSQPSAGATSCDELDWILAPAGQAVPNPAQGATACDDLVESGGFPPTQRSEASAGAFHLRQDLAEFRGLDEIQGPAQGLRLRRVLHLPSVQRGGFLSATREPESALLDSQSSAEAYFPRPRCCMTTLSGPKSSAEGLDPRLTLLPPLKSSAGATPCDSLLLESPPVFDLDFQPSAGSYYPRQSSMEDSVRD